MKLNGKEISELTDAQVIANYENCLKLEAIRNQASRHEKFTSDRKEGNKTIKKLDFPPANPSFVELKNSLHQEIKNRKLDIHNAPSSEE